MSSSSAPPKRFISTEAAAEYLDVNPRSIRNWIAQGKITGYRVGRLVKVDQNELDAFARPIPAAG